VHYTPNDKGDFGDLLAAIGAPGVQDRVGPPDGVLHLRVLAQQRTGAAARRLAAGEIDQRVDASIALSTARSRSARR
jgi:hypothetical protein